MKFLLTSGGIQNKSLEQALLDLTERPFSELNIAVIPTAINPSAGNKDWYIQDLVKCQELGFKQVDVVDISALPKTKWLPRLEEADVFYVEGGDTYHLMSEIGKSGLKEELPRLLESRVYIGVSAGSIVVCRSLDSARSEYLYQEKVEGSDVGLDYFDFIIRPHLNSPYFPNMTIDNIERVAVDERTTSYVLDDNSAIKIDGDKIEVISEGIWKKFN